MTKLSDYEKDLIEIVEEHGFQYTYVFDPDGNDPAFCYSVGFSKTLNAQEFIIFGLSKDLMGSMLWSIFRQIKAGLKIEDGARVAALLDGFDCVIRKAVRPMTWTEYTLSANWFWRRNGNDGNPEVYQIVWPGAQQGLFPWEEDCDQYVIDMQPPLWEET